MHLLLGNVDENSSATPMLGGHLAPCAKLLGLCRDIAQSLATCLEGLGIKADGTIFHHQAQSPVFHLKRHNAGSGPGVTQTVAHGLTRNGQAMLRLFRGELACSQSVDTDAEA